MRVRAPARTTNDARWQKKRGLRVAGQESEAQGRVSRRGGTRTRSKCDGRARGAGAPHAPPVRVVATKPVLESASPVRLDLGQCAARGGTAGAVKEARFVFAGARGRARDPDFRRAILLLAAFWRATRVATRRGSAGLINRVSLNPNPLHYIRNEPGSRLSPTVCAGGHNAL